MEEIVGLSVVSAVGIELRKIFPDTTWYREVITNLRFPHFFVFQLTMEASEERLHYWWIDYLITIRYRVANDTTLVSNLNQQLDSTAMELLSNLHTINWFGTPHKIKNARYEKQEGVLHFFCNVRIHATLSKEEVAKQMTLDLNLNLGGE